MNAGGKDQFADATLAMYSAWYALYSYYNKGCNGDAWPAGEEKPVKPTD